MFTGIVEELGTVKHLQKGVKSVVLTIEAHRVLSDASVGSSIAVNGVCLTVTSFSQTNFTADVMHETLKRSSLGSLAVGSKVNLERAMAANGRFGGHIVAGHIDDTGIISTIKKDDNAVWYTIETTDMLLRYVIAKGSIAIDGISLTVATLNKTGFSVSVIPHTLKNTVLAYKKVGDVVNLENDCIGKYVERLLVTQESKSNITKDFLVKYNY